MLFLSPAPLLPSLKFMAALTGNESFTNSGDKSSNRLCAVITEETVPSACRAIGQATRLADMVELRLDYLKDFDFANPDGLRPLLQYPDRKGEEVPIIITCRAVSEGGRQSIDDEVRLRLLTEGLAMGADYCDIEAAFYDRAAKFSPDPSRLIVSYHNFEETPSDLDAIYDRVTFRPAAVHKIVTRANSVTDTLAVFRLLDRARSEGRSLIALAMGEHGSITRILSPARGGFLTYCTTRRGRESAPGQATCEELNDLYRIGRLSSRTAITGIIGRPVSHSASPAMHNRAFQSMGLDFVYLPIEVADPAEFFARFVRPASREIDWPLRGFSVTTPHKTAVLPLVDEVDETARKVGAVNTVVINEGRVTGYNTDVQGAMEPLENVCSLAGARCAVVGAGGAARAVVYGLRERGARVSVFARDPARAASLADDFGVSIFPIESLESSDASIIINATPVGQRGLSEGESIVPMRALAGRPIAYDLIYNPLETQFLKDARAAGCRTTGGLEMLVAQARLQFELWTGQRPSIDILRTAALEKIERDFTNQSEK
ncbi:MAG: shikimate dehydrogenase [Blastocatellia bacterium]|nr:shikimate dehydrogenase [Blastocatellia bacterium]